MHNMLNNVAVCGSRPRGATPLYHRIPVLHVCMSMIHHMFCWAR
jgi:hypothetical protein